MKVGTSRCINERVYLSRAARSMVGWPPACRANFVRTVHRDTTTGREVGGDHVNIVNRLGANKTAQAWLTPVLDSYLAFRAIEV